MEKAPTNFLKRVALINNSSTQSETDGLIPEMIRISQKAMKVGYLFTVDMNLQFPDMINNTFQINSSNHYVYNIRIPVSNCVYELDERWDDSTVSYTLKQEGTNFFGGISFTAANPSENIWGNQQAKIKIQKIEKERREEEGNTDPTRVAESLAYFASYPFEEWFSNEDTIWPLKNPKLYDFQLTQQGEDYVWTIALADPDQGTTFYAQDLWNTNQRDFKDIKGDGNLVVDSYSFLKALYILVMDQNGALKSFQYFDTMRAIKNSESLDVNYNILYTAQPVSPSWISFFEALFQSVWNDALKEGDEITLLDL